ncbi:hypothetical protein ACLOJK_014755 [Asimina triloba]
MRNGGVVEGAADIDDMLRMTTCDALHGVGGGIRLQRRLGKWSGVVLASRRVEVGGRVLAVVLQWVMINNQRPQPDDPGICGSYAAVDDQDYMIQAFLMSIGSGGGEQRQEEVSPADGGFMLVGVGAKAGGVSNGRPGSTDPGLPTTETKADGYRRNRRRDENDLSSNDMNQSGIEVMGVAMERVKLDSYGCCGTVGVRSRRILNVLVVAVVMNDSDFINCGPTVVGPTAKMTASLSSSSPSTVAVHGSLDDGSITVASWWWLRVNGGQNGRRLAVC